MRLTILPLLFLFTAGCASPGPGSTCDATGAEANPVGTGNQAAAAANKGGQSAINAPLVEDTARIQPRTFVTRGAGDITATSADHEHREVASGGAQTQALWVPAIANATNNGGGGQMLAVRNEYAADLAALRAELKEVRADPELDPAEKKAQTAEIRKELKDTKADMALAMSSAGSSTVHNYGENFMSGDNVLLANSKSGTGPKEGEEEDAEAFKAVGTAAVGFPAPAPTARELPSKPADAGTDGE